MTAFTVHDGNLYFIAETAEQGSVAYHIKLVDYEFTVTTNSSMSAGTKIVVEGVVEGMECLPINDSFLMKSRLHESGV